MEPYVFEFCVLIAQGELLPSSGGRATRNELLRWEGGGGWAGLDGRRSHVACCVLVWMVGTGRLADVDHNWSELRET